VPRQRGQPAHVPEKWVRFSDKDMRKFDIGPIMSQRGFLLARLRLHALRKSRKDHGEAPARRFPGR
jgi:hypothetical protein